MGMRHNFAQLTAWQRARKLVSAIYLHTQPFPEEERFGLQSQMRRGVISIASNIAEGCERGPTKASAVFWTWQ